MISLLVFVAAVIYLTVGIFYCKHVMAEFAQDEPHLYYHLTSKEKKVMYGFTITIFWVIIYLARIYYDHMPNYSVYEDL